MTPFVVTQQDLFIISVVAHVCVLMELCADKMVEWLAPVLGERSSMVRTLTILHKQRPRLLAKILMEQITLWSIITLIMVALTYTSVTMTPFSHQPLPHPTFLIRFILEASVARFIVMATRIVLVRDFVMCQTKTISTPGQYGYYKFDFLYNAVSAVWNLTCLGFHENLLLGITASFMEISSVTVECCRLIEESKKSIYSKSYKKTAILNCGLCIICRVILPIMFLILACTQESPFTMDKIPLIGFFISAVFYSTFNVLLVCQSFIRVNRSLQQRRSQTLPDTSSTSIPFSVHVLPGDIVKAEAKVRNDHTNTNYGFLHSIDNRCLCCTLVPEDLEKMNTVEKKEASHRPHIHQKFPKPCGDILKKFNLNRRTRKHLEKSGSHDILLDNQDLCCDYETDSFMIDALNVSSLKVTEEHENVNCQSSEIIPVKKLEANQPLEVILIDKCDQFQTSEANR